MLQRNGTLYIGVTNNLIRRVQEHREKVCEGFTEKYDVIHLVYYETGESIEGAIMREKQLKKWKRKWKIELIESRNPKWKDLYEALVNPPNTLSQLNNPGSPRARG